MPFLPRAGIKRGSAILLLLSGTASAGSLSSGTGFYINQDGYVLTNQHVVQHCSHISVTGAGAPGDATLIAQDNAQDLALLKTSAIPAASAVFSDGPAPRADDTVFIIGYPGISWRTGERVVREAHIVALHGTHGEENWLQFSDALAPGNSGGPLLDASGHVIGVVSGKATLSRYNESAARDDVFARFDVAIRLPVVQGFLDANHIFSRSETGNSALSADRVADQAQAFVVNVQCRME